MEAKLLPIAMIEPNEGQIKGLPRNPRFIRDERYEKLKQSITEAPEMMEMRQLIVVEHGKKVVVICGNMRLRACQELGYTELPCYVLPKTTPANKLREYTIKDNIGYGQTDWGAIAAEWDTSELDGWGMEVDGFWDNSSGEQQPTWQGAQPANNGGAFNPSDLPPELQGMDINPDDLPKLQGEDSVVKERIIIVYDKGQAECLAEKLGLTAIDKVVYDLNELFVG